MIEKIYIIHFKDLNDRKIYLDENLLNLSIPYEFIISDSDSDDIKIQNIDKYYKYDNNIFSGTLSRGELCVSISHFEAYKKILYDNVNNALIIEDDALFVDGFLDGLVRITNDISKYDYDMCFISECCNLHISRSEGCYPSEKSRCVTGYIVNSKNLKLIIDSIPFQYPIDFHLNHIKKKLNLKYFWSEPCIIIQGSESVYKSNLR